jgi:iron complex transport system substrate-binding protein
MPARGAFLQEVPLIVPRAFAAALFLLCSASLAGAQASFPLRVTDDTGAAVTLAARPVRIISLTLATDEILLTMVDPARLAAVSLFAVDPGISNVADHAAGIPNKLDVNVETILSLRPDLVIVADWSDAGPVRQLRDAGVPLYQMKSAVTVAAIEQKIMRLALLTSEDTRGREMVAAMRGRLSAIDRRVSALPADKRLRAIDYATWGAAMGRGSSWDEMLRRAGLVDGVGELSADEWGQVPLSREKLLQLDPDLLILPGWVYGDPRKATAFFAQITGDPSLKGLRAVRTDRVYQMPEKLKSTTSQYFADAVEWLARTAYPALFR